MTNAERDEAAARMRAKRARDPVAYRAQKKKDREKYRARRMNMIEGLVEAAKARGCACGERRLAALDLHHRDPRDKMFTLGDTETLRRVALDAVKAEIEKCDVMCANCHRCHHAVERRGAAAGIMQPR